MLYICMFLMVCCSMFSVYSYKSKLKTHFTEVSNKVIKAFLLFVEAAPLSRKPKERKWKKTTTYEQNNSNSDIYTGKRLRTPCAECLHVIKKLYFYFQYYVYFVGHSFTLGTDQYVFSLYCWLLTGFTGATGATC